DSFGEDSSKDGKTNTTATRLETIEKRGSCCSVTTTFLQPGRNVGLHAIYCLGQTVQIVKTAGKNEVIARPARVLAGNGMRHWRQRRLPVGPSSRDVAHNANIKLVCAKGRIHLRPPGRIGQSQYV